MSAEFRADGSCGLVDAYGVTVTWPTAVEWADAWLAEWRRGAHGPAGEFLDEMTASATDGVVAVLVVLAERAAESAADELSWVGAGPLEDLVSHSGHGTDVLDEVERVALGRPAFAEALTSVWLGSDVDPRTRSRLVALGARDLTAPRS